MDVGNYRLSVEKIQNPHLVLSELFCSFPHSKIRELLWEWMKSTFCGNFNTYLDVEEKAMIVDLYERIEKLIDAAHILFNSEKVS